MQFKASIQTLPAARFAHRRRAFREVRNQGNVILQPRLTALRANRV